MQMPRTFIRLFLRPLLLLIPILLPVAAGSAEQPRYILAVVPNMPAVTLHRSWTPLVDRISRETGVKIELKLYDRITTFIEASDAGIPDFLYSAPNMFYQAYQKQKYIPLLRSSNYFRGRVFVRRDSPYRKVSDLAGRTIAFVGPRNLCSVMTRQAMLAGEGPIDYNARFSGSTVNVAKSVLFGKADAGVTLDVNMTGDFPEMMEEFAPSSKQRNWRHTLSPPIPASPQKYAMRLPVQYSPCPPVMPEENCLSMLTCPTRSRQILNGTTPSTVKWIWIASTGRGTGRRLSQSRFSMAPTIFSLCELSSTGPGRTDHGNRNH